ncbi:hypothetical protein XH98_06225 [Bradyrhizobium sp. CCBAU 51745]|nr:hypothetical protein [Bradyrhizobium sp. CCBAU 51745]
MRLDAANKIIEDYVLLPPPMRAGRYVWLSSDSSTVTLGRFTPERTRVRSDQKEVGQIHPCRASQLSAADQAKEAKPAQNQGLRRAVPTVRR